MLLTLVVSLGELEGALNILERASTQHPLGVQDALVTVQEQLRSDDENNWHRAMTLLERRESPMPVRARLLDILTEKAQGRRRTDLIKLASQWALELRRSNLHDPGLVQRFLGVMDDQSWACVRAEPEAVVFLGHVIRWDIVIDPQSRLRAMRLLASSAAPRELVDRVVLEAIETGAVPERVPEDMVPLLDESMFSQLRAIVRESKPLHGLATAALAHLGDREIRAELVNRERQGDRRALAARSIWQIDVQQSTDALLRSVAVAEGVDGPNGQKWALRRALELGIDKAGIRDAALAYAAHAKPVEIGGKQHPNPELIGLKDLALRLGILQPTDLPEVPAPIRVTP
jgi:hypothetical protein